MNKAHEQLVDSQFGPRAKAYVESAVHARGPDLDALEAVVSGMRPARVLDLGFGLALWLGGNGHGKQQRRYGVDIARGRSVRLLRLALLVVGRRRRIDCRSSR